MSVLYTLFYLSTVYDGLDQLVTRLMDRFLQNLVTMSFHKLASLISCTICLILFQNCAPNEFQPNQINTTAQSNTGSSSRSENTNLSQAENTEASQTETQPISNNEETASAPQLNLEFQDLIVQQSQSNKVTVSWKQNIEGTGQVYFGLSERALDSKTEFEPMALSTHIQTLKEELLANQTYYFKAVSSVGGQKFESKIISLYYGPNTQTPDQAQLLDNVEQGDIASSCDQSKPLCGIMYGIPISGDSYGHTQQYKHSAIIKFQAEKTGTIVAYKHLNRVYRKSEWDRDDNGDGFNEKYKCKNTDPICKMKVMKNGGYHEGDGGLLQFALHADNGNGEPAEKPLSLGKKTLVPTKHKHYVGTLEGVKYYVGDITYEHIEWKTPVQVQLGKYYHIVIKQLEPKKGLVVLDGFRTNQVPLMFGGPYYGNRFTVSTKNSADRQPQVSKQVFPDFKIHYDDGIVAGTGNEGVGGQYAKYKVQGQNMVRQVFTMDYNAEMSGLWIRAKHSSGNSPLIITVKTGDGSVVTQISSPVSKTTPAKIAQLSWSWFYNKFNSPITLLEGRKYYVEFKTQSNTSYSIQTEETFDFNGGNRLSKDSVWKGSDDRAEFSTAGEKSFKPVPSSIKDLAILFTVNGQPEVVK